MTWKKIQKLQRRSVGTTIAVNPHVSTASIPASLCEHFKNFTQVDVFVDTEKGEFALFPIETGEFSIGKKGLNSRLFSTKAIVLELNIKATDIFEGHWSDAEKILICTPKEVKKFSETKIKPKKS